MKFGYWHQSTKAFTHPYKKSCWVFFGQQICTLFNWRQYGEKNPSENGASLKNGPVHFVTSPLFGFSHVLYRHVRSRCQSPSSPGPLEMERHIGQTARGVDSQPGRRSRRSRRRRQWVLAAAERSGRSWHGLLQYGTSPVWTAGKIRQLWSILMKPDNLHAVSRLKRWLKQAKDASGSSNLEKLSHLSTLVQHVLAFIFVCVCVSPKICCKNRLLVAVIKKQSWFKLVILPITFVSHEVSISQRDFEWVWVRTSRLLIAERKRQRGTIKGHDRS